MDDALQTLRRRAEQDPTLRPQLLVARVRAGELAQDRLELAAYVGDVDARAALGWEHGEPLTVDAGKLVQMPVGEWVAGLRRWDEDAAVHAALVAARVALPSWERGEETCCCGSGYRGHGWGDGHSFTHVCDYYRNPLDPAPCECVSPAPRRAVEAAEAWLARPSEESMVAWQQARLAAGLDFTMAWLPFPLVVAGVMPGILPARDRELRNSVTEAAALAGEPAVRAAIRDALTAWALGDR